MLNGSPRAVDATLAVPGQSLGPQAAWGCLTQCSVAWFACPPTVPCPAPYLYVAGPARGSQSVYDRALRCVYGTDDSALSGARRWRRGRTGMACRMLRCSPRLCLPAWRCSLWLAATRSSYTPPPVPALPCPL